MDKDYKVINNENGNVTFKFDYSANFVQRESIVYLKETQSYSLLSGAILNGFSGINIYSINITSNITNIYKEYEEEKGRDKEEEEGEEEEKEKEEEEGKEEEKEEEEKEEKKEGGKEEGGKEEEGKEEEEKEGKEEEEKEEKKEEEREENNYIIEEGNKCSSYTDESLKMNLCIKCNIKMGYYPVDFKGYNIFPKNFIECFNDSSKLINFYFNENKKQYEPCYETCNTCIYGGNDEINNCTSCDIGSIFRPETIGTTNCVKKCKYKYYFTSYGHYKCSDSEQCPKEANLYIPSKNKCINDCKLDNEYKFQFNGECLEKCPNDTKEYNNICININKDKCSFKQNEEYIKEFNISIEDMDLLAKTYTYENKLSNNHILIYKNNFSSITIYKNKNCIDELSLNVPQIDFGSCYDEIKTNNLIDSDLIIIIYEKSFNSSSKLFYQFYNPFSGDKIDISKECPNNNITVKKDILALLEGTKLNIDNILVLTQQNIDIFDKSSDFYNDICFNYESPNGKDIPLKDRLKEFYPNITLCNEGCFYNGVNLTSMTSICQCKFSDFIGENSFTENAFISKISEEISEIILQSNLIILQCYQDVFSYKYFIKNTGGFIILTIIIFQTICFLTFYFINSQAINKYVFILMEIYLSFLDKSNISKDKNNIIKFLKNQSNPPKERYKKNEIIIINKLVYNKVSKSKDRSGKKLNNKNNKNHENQAQNKNIKKKENKNGKDKIKNNKKSNKTIIYQNNSNILKLNIKKIEINNNINKEKRRSKKNKTLSIKLNKSGSNQSKNKLLPSLDIELQESRSKSIQLDKSIVTFQLNKNINNFVEKYLTEDIDDKDYDDAIRLDKREFCQYFWEKIKSSQFILDIILINEPLKPKPIKILLFLINIDLYFLVNGLFMNEDYISEIYHSTDDKSIFSFVKRTNNNLFYISTISAFSGYLINCFFFEEKKIKHIFIREKKNQFNIKKEIFLLIHKIKSGYFTFFIVSYIITFFSWYFISCFNNVYPYTRKEWIISSIFIFLAIQIFFLFLTLFETILRYMSFKIKSEKLFKVSQIFS